MNLCHSYSKSSSDGQFEELEGSEVAIDVRSFRGAVMIVKVKKKPGMEGTSLLGDKTLSEGESATDGEDSGIWNTIYRYTSYVLI